MTEMPSMITWRLIPTYIALEYFRSDSSLHYSGAFERPFWHQMIETLL
jgi:hypothetical protein